MRWSLTLVIIPAPPAHPERIPCPLGADAQSALGELHVSVCVRYGDHWSLPRYFTPGKCLENVAELSPRVCLLIT